MFRFLIIMINPVKGSFCKKLNKFQIALIFLLLRRHKLACMQGHCLRCSHIQLFRDPDIACRATTFQFAGDPDFPVCGLQTAINV